jgi:hypothetical protein
VSRAGLALLASVASSCAIRDARTSGQSGEPCSTSDQCQSSVCFLGECRATSSALALVHAEVRTGDSRYGTLQSSAIDPRKTAVADFTLQPLLTISGRVMQRADPPATGATPVADATVVFTDRAPAIPDRIVSISAQSDSNPASTGTYTVRLPASTYDVLVAPSSEPVAHPDGPVAVSSSSLDLVLPAKASLMHLRGTLQINGTGRLSGAQVSAVDATGTSIAVPQISAADGTFALDLPPGPPAFSLQVGPASTPSANDPVPSFNSKGFAAGQADLGIVDLGTLPATATLTGKVVDARGAAIASARVFLLSTGAPSYLLSRQTTTLSDGTFSVVVRVGTYLVEAAPDVDPSQPAVSDPITLPISGSLDLGTPIVCPDKVRVSGTVVRSDGRAAAAGFRVDATRVADPLVTGRGTRTAATDATGAFSLVLDSGQYKVEIIPTVESAQPRTILAVDVPATAAPAPLPLLHISPPHELFGTVRAGNPPVAIPGATIDFYAIDSTGRKSVLIGNAVADSSGQYRAVLPDVSQFAAQ